MSQMCRRRLAGSEVQAWSKGASSLAACGNMQQASGVYMETLWRPPSILGPVVTLRRISAVALR